MPISEMLRKCPSVPQSYKDEEYKLYLRYKPIENDPNMNIEDKSQHLIEWYRAAFDLMKYVVVYVSYRVPTSLNKNN